MITVDNKQLIQGYRAYLKGRGLKAWDPFRWHLGVFLNWMAQERLSLSELNCDLVEDYLRYRKSLKHRSTPVTAALDALRSFLRYARHDGLISGDPTQGISCGWLNVPGGYPAYHGVLQKILHHPGPMARHRFPLLAADWDSYLSRLLDQGFTKRTLHDIVFHNSHFSRFLASKKIQDPMRITPTLLESFLRHKCIKFQKSHGMPPQRKYIQKIRHSIEDFLTYAFNRHNKIFRPKPTEPVCRALPGKLLNRYMNFCRLHRGLKTYTQRHHLYWLRQFGAFLMRRRVRKVQAVAVTDLDAFAAELGKRMGASALQKPLAVLRGFFHYLYLNNQIATDLAGSLISPCRFRSDRRPKYLPWHKIQSVLAAIDRSHSVGKRDYAILSLLAYHGLRVREVANLKIADIQWDHSSFWVKERKNGTSIQLPLLPQVKEALQDYLSIRPACSASEIFLTALAPVRPLGGSATAVAQAHLRKHFNGSLPSYGAYVLRHSFAKTLLDRGAKLHDIGTMLGHKSLRSTLIYTHIATEELRDVADNYAHFLGPKI